MNREIYRNNKNTIRGKYKQNKDIEALRVENNGKVNPQATIIHNENECICYYIK